MKKSKIKVKDRFILEALTSTGYDVYSAIYELIDNSIDANATEINISYDKDNETLVIEDNGKGMSFNKLNEAMNLGCDRAYSTTEIGYFGVGMKSSCLNLIDLNNKSSKISIKTNNGLNTSQVLWNPLVSPMDYEIDSVENKVETTGTLIKICGIKKFIVQILKKNCGIIFYPILKNEIVKIFVDEDEIVYNDPLYRNSELTIKNYVKAHVSNTEIDIECSLIDNAQEKHSWDRKEKTENLDEKWSYAKGGVYFVYGGRYIEYGGAFGIKNNDPWDSRTRIELAIPKNLTEVFGIKFNKTNGINLRDNDKINDVVKKIKDMFNWAKTIRKKNGENITTEEEKNDFKKINDELNKSAKKAGFKTPKKDKSDVSEKVEFFTNPEEEKSLDKTNKEEKKQRKATLYDKKIFDIKTENLGSTNCFWSLGYENNVFIITLNEAHVFFRDIYRNLNESGRKDIIYLLASMGYAQYETQINHNNFNEEFFWEDYWSQVSLKLKHLISL